MMVLVCWAWLNRICDATDRPWAMPAIELIAYTYSIHSVSAAQIARIKTNEAHQQCAKRHEVSTAKCQFGTVDCTRCTIFYRWVEQDDFVSRRNWPLYCIFWQKQKLTSPNYTEFPSHDFVTPNSKLNFGFIALTVCSSLASIEFKFIGCVVWCHHPVPTAPASLPTSSNGICLTCIQFLRRIIALKNLTRLYYVFPHLAFRHIPLRTTMISLSIDYISVRRNVTRDYTSHSNRKSTSRIAQHPFWINARTRTQSRERIKNRILIELELTHSLSCSVLKLNITLFPHSLFHSQVECRLRCRFRRCLRVLVAFFPHFRIREKCRRFSAIFFRMRANALPTVVALVHIYE